ncbi:MAG TPA: hypothetical protein VGR57_15625 [Ktedonobacterales bacterium]|nr:hypothetical protein [Ktedonobacterales bacterium]
MSRYPRDRYMSRFSEFSLRAVRGWRARAARGAQAARTLDAWLRRLRHRWETDAAWRGRTSVIAGGSAVIAMCALMAIVASVANAAIQVTPGGDAGTATDGGVVVNGVPIFPTETLAAWTPGTVPNGAVVPASGTSVPQPVATATATPSATPSATAETSPVPTGTVGSVPTTCNGAQGTSAWALAPCPQLAGQPGTLTIAAPGHGGASLNILINFGSCPGGGSCTVLYPPGQYSLDASGNATVPYTVPAGAAHSSMPISGMINISNGPTLAISAAPVQ